ncbi:MAG: transglutaminase domain-containing protein [Lachnospiraceae bacterium]|nr:transglutaminase domain-containing protein [Lachnospiraceae bacterium]
MRECRFEDIQYLNVELPEDILKKKYFGDFEGAARLIDIKLGQDIPDALRRKLLVEKEILHILPKEYIYSFEEAMEKIRKKIPDFTEEEFREREELGRIDWFYVNGEVRYIDSFLGTLLKTDASLAERARKAEEANADKVEGQTAAPVTKNLLDEAIAKMKEKGSLTCHFKIRGTIQIGEEAFVPGKKVKAWLPLPIDCIQVKNPKVIKTEPEATYIAPETAPQRTAYFEKVMTENTPFLVEYEYDNTVNYVDPKPEVVEEYRKGGEKPFPAFDPEKDLPGRGEPTLADISEQAPHIVFTPYIRALKDEIAGDETNPLLLARRFYDFVTTKVKYSFMREYFAIENIPEYAALNNRADCGVQALLFITLCRCAGIPARWQSGLNARPDSVGSHDWAMFYVAPYGWMFNDCSFGGGAYRAGALERWNYYFCNLDPYRMPANCMFQAQFDPPYEHMRRDPYDNQSGEMEYEDRGLRWYEVDRNREILEAYLVE